MTYRQDDTQPQDGSADAQVHLDALREILDVINNSRDDERPVFDTLLRAANRLCGASTAGLLLGRPNDRHLKLAAVQHSDDTENDASADRIVRANTPPMDMDPAVHVSARAICEGSVVHIADLAETDSYKAGIPSFKIMVEEMGQRSTLSVPLMDATGPIGAINLHRKTAGLFSESEISLIKSFATQAVIAIENVRQFREVQTRLERERASSEILEVISQSRDDEGPVFDAILSNASHLCHAPIAGLVMVDDERKTYGLRASRGAKPEFVEALEKNPPALDPERFAAARAIVEQRIVHVDDLASPNLYGADDKHRIRTTQLEGIRTVLFVPLIWEQQSIGAIGLWRREVKPFSEDEIALVETFAAQAVIAIENVRQFREVQERLERERASSEILQVISQSRDDDTPVFKTIVENAARLCNAPMTFLVLIKEDHSQWKVAAATGDATSMMQVGNVFDVGQEFAPYQSIKTRRIVEEPDVRETDFYKSRHPDAIKLADEDGIRSRVFVPLVSGGKSLGNLVLLRREVGHFAPEDLLLVETFAAQAVIAIENVRQFRKVQTQLERERATSEILKVISESRDDETPVFDLMLRKAAELCNADAAALALGTKGDTYQTMPASYGIAPATQEMYDSGHVPMDPETSVGAKAILSGKPVHVRDMSDTEQYRSGVSIFQSVVQDTGIRTNLLVPLLTPTGGIGVLILFRKEVRPYTEDEIALVETFAAQAVIAIENVGQFREVQERLKREAATSEVLSIISQSRDDERPVFDTILKKAAELCDANQASLQLANAERTHFGVAAYWGFEETAFQVGGSAPLDSGRPIPQVISTGCSMNIKDLSQSDHYLQEDPIITHVVDIEGIRSWLIVPLMKDKQAIGAIALSRREVKSFNEFEIALVETFAAQAVIAIENVRQFREVQERLEREAATSEILRVISQSQEDEAQVFDIILEKSVILCQADQSVLFLINAERTSMYLAAHWGHSRTEFSIGRSWPLEAAMSATEAIRSTLVQHILDFAETERYKSREEEAIQMVENEGIRTRLVVPLLRDGVAIGAIAMSRREVRAFAASEIKLAETFAAQAVIAIENVRQFKALERLNAELGERVEEQVGEIERMGRLKRFLPAAVADTVVSQGSDNLLKSHRALLGVLFCDIRGFTAFCETAEPEETIEVLQSYHEEMGALIAAHGAGVDTRAGDGIMVLFNDPLPCDDPAGDALRLGLAMRERMAELSKKWRRHGHRLGFGVGISLGYATVGMVGSAGRFDYTASGTAVNLAARLCDQAKDGEILLSPRAYTAVEDDFDAEPVGELTLKGIHAPVEVFRVLTES